jgi:hypothetical protein
LSRGPYDRSEGKLDPQTLGVPTHNERRDDRLIVPRRGAEEIDDRDLLLHCIPEPAVIRRVRVGAHEQVIDDIITGIDLAMSFALVVIPDSPSASREHGSDGQQPCHLPRLEDAALRVD